MRINRIFLLKCYEYYNFEYWLFESYRAYNGKSFIFKQNADKNFIYSNTKFNWPFSNSNKIYFICA